MLEVDLHQIIDHVSAQFSDALDDGLTALNHQIAGMVEVTIRSQYSKGNLSSQIASFSRALGSIETNAVEPFGVDDLTL